MNRQVIVLTSKQVVRFKSLLDALDSKIVDTGDRIFLSERHFQQAANPRIVDEIHRNYPVKAVKTTELYHELLNLSVTEEEVQVKKPKIKSTGSGAGRPSKYDDACVIEVLEKNPPKKQDSLRRFQLYQTGMTVGEYLEAGGQRLDVIRDAKKKFIKVRSPAT